MVGLEALVLELVRALSAQGTAYTLLALSILGHIVGLRLLFAEKDKCLTLQDTLQEKRLNERSETIKTLHASTEVNRELAKTFSVRTETLNNLIIVITSGFERLERMIDGQGAKARPGVGKGKAGLFGLLPTRAGEGEDERKSIGSAEPSAGGAGGGTGESAGGGGSTGDFGS